LQANVLVLDESDWQCQSQVISEEVGYTPAWIAATLLAMKGSQVLMSVFTSLGECSSMIEFVALAAWMDFGASRA
jgi:hypothetical protein